MTHAQNEAHKLFETFEGFGMDTERALLYARYVANARYSEALINAPYGSRVKYWEDVYEELLNLDEAVHSSTR